MKRPEDGVVLIALSRPESLNAMNADLVRALARALDEVEADLSCRVVVLTGVGRAFCAGLDLHGYGGEDHFDREGRVGGQLAMQREISGLAVRLHRMRQPVVAAVNGPAAGGGLALVCASDVRIASSEAVFAVSFIRAGFSACDIGVSWLLPRIVGAGHAHELMLTGRRFDATEALRIGLVTEVCSTDLLIDAALAKAREIMLNPPFSVELTKQGMWAALEIPSFATAVEFENRQQVLTSLTADRDEATSAFLDKRSPHYERR